MGVYSCTDGSINSQSFLSWCAVCTSYAFLRLERSLLRCYSPGHIVLQMQPHVISFHGVTSRIRFMLLLFPQVFQNWRYESELPLKPPPLTCYKQFGTNSIIVLMFVESQRVHIWAPVRYETKTWRVVLLNKKIHILLSQVYCEWQVVKTPTIISNNSVLLVFIFKD